MVMHRWIIKSNSEEFKRRAFKIRLLGIEFKYDLLDVT